MLSLLLSVLLSAPVDAAELAGVTLPDTAAVGGQSLVLNGMGLREKYFIDVYVGGLYLPAKTADADAAINQDVPKRVVMHFIYSEISKDQLAETFYEGLENYPQYAAVRPALEQLVAGMSDMKKGDEIIVDYAPGVGTVISTNGVAQAPIPDADLMKLVFSMFIGPKPATAKLKAGMMGG